jgi:hypothetical protein
MRRDRGKLSVDQQYIHEVNSRDGVDLIVTMLSGLAKYIHTASATLHDNTYSRLHGNWKAWDVVIWLKRANMRAYYPCKSMSS